MSKCTEHNLDILDGGKRFQFSDEEFGTREATLDQMARMYEYDQDLSPGFVTDVEFKRQIYFEKYDNPDHTSDERIIEDNEIIESLIAYYLFEKQKKKTKGKSFEEISEALKKSQASGSRLQDTQKGVAFETEDFGTVEISSEKMCALLEKRNGFEKGSIIDASEIYEDFYFTFSSPRSPHLEYPNNKTLDALEADSIVRLLKSDAYDKYREFRAGAMKEKWGWGMEKWKEGFVVNAVVDGEIMPIATDEEIIALWANQESDGKAGSLITKKNFSIEEISEGMWKKRKILITELSENENDTPTERLSYSFKDVKRWLYDQLPPEKRNAQGVKELRVKLHKESEPIRERKREKEELAASFSPDR